MPATENNSNKPSVLKNAREAKGLTLEMVHEATKIPLDALKAIEEGYSVRLLSPFYYRGFIKIYSEFLGLNVAEMYKEYGIDETPRPLPVSSGEPDSRFKKSHRREVQPASPNVFLEKFQELLAAVFKPKNLILLLKIAAFVLLFVLLFKTAGCVAAHLHKRPMLKRPAASGQAPHVQASSISGASVSAQSQDNKVELAVRASQDTWLRVKTDGKVVFETTLSKGSMESWSADDRIELSGRDLEQLDMEVNNKQIGFLGGGDRRIRRVLITQEGLTVKK